MATDDMIYWPYAKDPEELMDENEHLRKEVKRLRKSVEDWHDAAVRAERNAAMSQEETLSHIDRIAALMDEAERLREDHKYACDVADNLRAEIKTLRNQAVANTEDAERYRWLRSHGLDRSNGFYHVSWQQEYDDDYPCSDEEIDAAIDEAIREGK